MASTAHKTEAEYKEHFDSAKILKEKVDLLASVIKEAKHLIFFTGAGISTSAGIGDFRSGLNTVLETGAGAWTARAALQNGKTTEKALQDKRKKYVSTNKAIPTLAHMALVALEQEGLLKFLVSQNCDGLHRRSGFRPQVLAELHGNSNLEYCKDCRREYLRDYGCRNSRNHVHDHKTIRKCACGGDLFDSIINFEENLPEKAIDDAFSNARKADVCVVLGSSLRVVPAADVPAEVAENGGMLFIVNLQSTPLDDVSIRINGTIDTVMGMLMKKLDIDVPSFELSRFFKVNIEPKEGKIGITVAAVDSDMTPASIFTSVNNIRHEPFVWTEKSVAKIRISFKFQGHYREPPFTFCLQLIDNDLFESRELLYSLRFSISLQEWTIVAM